MPNSANLDYKAEQALINWLGASGTHGTTLGVTTIVHGSAVGDLTLPFITVTARPQDEHLKDSGHWRVGIEVALHTQADDTSLATADGYWNDIRSLLCWDELAARLSDLKAFNCWIVIRDGGESTDLDERSQVRTSNFTIICQAADNT